jgi:molecular chaperone DnaK (HSP70)
MSVAGFDIGSQTSTVAVARKRGIDVLLNKESNRETPSLVRAAVNSLHRTGDTSLIGSLAMR